MFQELINFKYKRTRKQAFGFYIFYLIIGGLLGGIISALAQLNSGADAQTQFNLGLKIGFVVSIIFCPVLSLLQLINKKLHKSALAILLFLLTFVCTILMGSLLGCVCPAILSTFDAKE